MYKKFNPDLIIEVTSVCDKACNGCYASNFVTKVNPEELYQSNPNLFLNLNKLNSIINSTYSLKTVALRGGEPTRHPHLSEIIYSCKKAFKEIYLETHGKWILEQNRVEELLFSIKKTSTTIKISYDKMHGTSVSELFQMMELLKDRSIPYLIAITESCFAEFIKTRTQLHWIEDSNIVFQKKASTTNELIKPSIGVIGVNGKIKQSLSHKNDDSIYIYKRQIAL